MKKYHDHLSATQKGFLSAADDAIFSENFIGTSLGHVSRFWKRQFPQITMMTASLGLASPD